ncbi:hypothetical protein BGZ95_009681 [Linnemannia exigua]|uniref:Uncharacterized protein n=1 Tax=Linnemannia exigua TaxID=604196 RepID=A0AAD4DCV7_9FUNG|nr:hypothetical protein BGZ95_009681 [Linnemannia exigua]
MTVTQRLYRLTHTTLTRIHQHHYPNPPKALQITKTPHPLVTLENLTSFAAGVFLHEHETIPLPISDTSPRLTTKEVTKKCNVLEWEAKLSGRNPHLNDSLQQEKEVLDQEEPPLPTSLAGVIFVSTTSSGTTTSMDESNVDRDQERDTDSITVTANKGSATEEDEKITSFLFARYEPSIPELQARLKTDLFPPPAPPLPNQPTSDREDPDSLTSVPFRIQKLIESRGVTRIWLCGTDPAFRRHHLMSTHLGLLEQEVLQWKSDKTHHGAKDKNKVKEKEKEKEERVSGVVTAHTVPLRFPGMVQFLIKNGFKGGDLIKTSEDKAFYWKEIK